MSPNPALPPETGLGTTARSLPYGGIGVSSCLISRRRGVFLLSCPKPSMASPESARQPSGRVEILKTSWVPGALKRQMQPSPPLAARAPCSRAGGAPPSRTPPPPGKAPEIVSASDRSALTPALPPESPQPKEAKSQGRRRSRARLGSRRPGRLQGTETSSPGPAATRKHSARK